MVENSENTLHFHQYFKVIRNRIWIIFTIFILTVLSGEYVTEEVQSKVYSASAQIQIHPRGETSVDSFGGGTTEKNFDPTAFQAEFVIMKSDNVLTPVVQKLGLDKTWAKRVYKSDLDALPMQETLKYLNHVLEIDFSRGTNIIEVTGAERSTR